MAELLGPIKPATLAQVRRGRNGRMVEIDADVFDVAKRLHHIDRSLGVDWNDAGGYFRITQLLENGRKHVVMTCLELTPAVINEVLETMHPEYDLAGHLDRKDDERIRDRDHAFSEQTGVVGERLFHAFRKDLEDKSRIFVPAGVRSVEGR